MDSPSFDIIAYVLLALLGVLAVVFLGNVLLDDVKRRRLKREAAAVSATESVADERAVAQATRESRQGLEAAAEPEPETEPTSEPETEPTPEAKPEPTLDPEHAPKPSRLPKPKPRVSANTRRRLQTLLDRGVALQQNVRSPLSANFGLLHPPTREEDVTAWEAAVEAELMDRPKDLALFRYERPRSPLAALSVAPLDSSLRRRLEQRNEQLSVIIRRMP